MEIGQQWGLFEYRPAAWLKVTGQDAAGYLQGQFSQDLKALGAGQSTYGLMLNHKGRIQADGFIVKESAELFWIGSYECPGELLRARLESFIVADDVTVENQTAEWMGASVISLSDSGGGSLQGLRANPGLPLPPQTLSFPGRRAAAPSWEYLFPADALRPRFPSARHLTPDAVELARIQAGIPSIPRDAGPGDLPQEVGLVLPAVSFTKGCYVGQEIMARLKTRGRIRRQLRQVRFPFQPLPAGRPLALYQADKLIGELRSWSPDGSGAFLGLAMIPADAPAGAQYALTPGGEPVIQFH